MTKIRMLLTLCIGVVYLRVASSLPEADQSQLSIPDEPPIESSVGQRRMGTPEVVLQLKYQSGELNRIYLAQFRKDQHRWVPSVPARTDLCADLCHAGLGGSSCGASCQDMLPVGLQAALHDGNRSAAGTGVYGHPRVAVCPTLCEYGLGRPLCNCEVLAQDAEQPAADGLVDWGLVCASFCTTDRYVLRGCPVCDDSTVPTAPAVRQSMARILDTEDGWVAWCNVQCQQGQGGAACNCDRAPFS